MSKEPGVKPVHTTEYRSKNRKIESREEESEKQKTEREKERNLRFKNKSIKYQWKHFEFEIYENSYFNRTFHISGNNSFD